MRWISIKEGLPIPFEDVQACYKTYNKHKKWVRFFTEHDGKKWGTEGDSITHWKYEPRPPEPPSVEDDQPDIGHNILCDDCNYDCKNSPVCKRGSFRHG